MRLLQAILALTAVSGCAGASGDVDPATQALEGSFAMVQLEGGDDSVTEVLGAVVRYRGVEAQTVADLLGARGLSPLESCVLSEGEVSLDFGAEVDLRSAGTLEILAAADVRPIALESWLEQSALSGVYYAAQLENLDVSEDVVVRAGGSAFAAPFDVAISRPARLDGVWIDGISAGDANILVADRAFEIAWEAGDPRDRIEIELTLGGTTMRCACRDDGSFRIDAGPVMELETETHGRLVLRRVRMQPFDLTGLDAAWISAASMRNVDFALQQ